LGCDKAVGKFAKMCMTKESIVGTLEFWKIKLVETGQIALEFA
jgi:hypothetical protein